ncbi:hypothetical protein [Roseinatronobacter alkalisoli]|uniref:Tip attachment protein J domain-containing protein n=1 Tax=Roseinatronobacter alkalisoli TaxID=3028235 RepID=A0ABT5TE98_9RHOB|nr:hypothetical protein [Roseinatronobacter sp. HJB301]MDD7973447.1 hypothetical protein [Roseinatronobacter sp. HJB301]
MTLSLLAQAVSLQGQVYRVSNCLIDEAIGSVPQVSFAVEMDANSGLPVPAIGMQFTVDQICDGLYSVMGEVTSVQRRRIPGGTQYRVTGMGEGRAAGERRWLGIVPAGPLGDSVRFLWQQVLQGVDLSLVPAAGPTLPDYPMAYASVSEFMDFVSNNTGWIWSLRNGVLRVFDPMVPGGNGWPLLPVSNTDFEANSLEITEGLDIINVARQQAWFTRRVTVTAPRFPIGCRSSVPLPNDLPKESEGWEFVGAQITHGDTVDGSDPQQVRITVDPDVAELSVGFWDWPRVTLVLEYRRLVWAEEIDHDSVDVYGFREGPPLPHDGAMGVQAAHDNLRTYLNGVSQPSIRLSGISLRADFRPGQQIQGVLPGLSGERRYLVKRIRRATSGTELQVQFEAETAGLVADPNLPPSTRPLGRSADGRGEMVRRLENLERGPLNPASRAGLIAAIVGPVPRPHAVAGGVAWGVTFTAVDPFRQHGEADTAVQWSVIAEGQTVVLNHGATQVPLLWTVEAQGVMPSLGQAGAFVNWEAEFAGSTLGLGTSAPAVTWAVQASGLPAQPEQSQIAAHVEWSVTASVEAVSVTQAVAAAPVMWTVQYAALNVPDPAGDGLIVEYDTGADIALAAGGLAVDPELD